jgi:hypothetical protein
MLLRADGCSNIEYNKCNLKLLHAEIIYRFISIPPWHANDLADIAILGSKFNA